MRDVKQIYADFLANRFQLNGFIYGLVRDPHVAEDIFQEVWLRLAGAVEKDDEVRDWNLWCRGVAKNLILQHWRRQREAKVSADTDLLNLIEQAFSEHDRAADPWAERWPALQRCIHLLPEHSRRLLHLKYVRGRAFAEMATELRRTTAAVMMAVSRIRRTLAECVEKTLRSAEQNP